MADLSTARREVFRAAVNLERVWRDPDPDAWRHIDAIPVEEAIERVCEAVDAARKEADQ